MSMFASRGSVAFVITSLDRGGAEKQVAEVALRLAERGWPVKGIVSLRPLTQWARTIADRGVPVYSVDIRNKFLDPGAAFRTWRLVRTLRPDVMITFLFHASILGALVGRAAGVRRIVASVRSQRMGSPRREQLFRWSEPLWHATVVNSNEVARELVDRRVVRPARCHVIPNGIGMPTAAGDNSIVFRDQLGIAEGTFIWLAVGALLPAKDYPSLLRAFRALDWSDAMLLVAGDGPLLHTLERMRDELGLNERVRFLGQRDDVDRLLETCDGFVSASAWEGMPNAIMEALAAARPVVATAVGGVPEVIHDGTGWVVRPGDPSALSAAMAGVMRLTEDARTSTAKRARAVIAEQYGWGRVIPMWEEMLQALLPSRPRPGDENLCVLGD